MFDCGQTVMGLAGAEACARYLLLTNVIGFRPGFMGFGRLWDV